MIRRVLVGGSVVALSCGALADAADPAVLARELRPTGVTSYAGYTAWSRMTDRECAEVRPRTCSRLQYSLIINHRGVTYRARVRSRSVPFDADLGPDSRGRPVIVYSRCRRDPSGTTDMGLPAYAGGDGCDIYQYDIASRIERRVRGLSLRAASEFLPSIWRGGIAFFRRSADEAATEAHLLLARSRRKTISLPTASRSEDGSPRLDGSAGGPGPLAIDLNGGRIGLAWQTAPRTCPGETDVSPVGFLRSELRLVRAGRSSLIEGSCGSGGAGTYFTSPQLTPRRLQYYWEGGVRRGASEAPGQVRAFDLRTHALVKRSATAPSPLMAMTVSHRGVIGAWRVAYERIEDRARRRDTDVGIVELGRAVPAEALR